MIFRKILIILIIFLTLGLGIAGFWYYFKNIYSKESLKLEILGSAEVELVEEIEYIIKYKNNGNIRLEEARLIFEYPEFSIIEEGSLRQETELPDIYPGEERTIPFKARLFGKEGEAKKAQAWLSYRPKNLKARFESATSHTTLIKFIPLTFEFDFSSKVQAEREIRLRLNYFSNVNYPLSDLRVKIDYPSDFQFLESEPQGVDKNEWEIGLLNKAEGGRIEIKGILSGEVFTQKIFKAQLIYWQDNKNIVLKETVKGLEIIRPSVFISGQVNGSPQYIANPGDYLHYEIFFKNIGESPLENLFLVVGLTSEILDFDTLQPGSGQFQEEINGIIWDQTMLPQLRLLSSMEEGKIEFWVKLKTDFPTEIRNPKVLARIDLNQAKEEIITKVNSRLVISQKGFFNQGPIPPQVGSTTTYTISWKAKSLYNGLKDTKIRAFLLNQVRLTGEFLPKEAKFFFDPASREIVWDIGDLPADESGPEIQFQIAFTPSSFQRGKSPDLISSAQLSGEDSWTEATITAGAPAVDTTLPDDPTITEEQGIVQ